MTIFLFTNVFQTSIRFLQLYFFLLWRITSQDKGSSYHLLNKFVGNTVTVMSPDGKPIQVNSTALQAAVTQNAVSQGMSNI